MYRCPLELPLAEVRMLSYEHTAELHALIERNRTYLKKWFGWGDMMRTQADVQRFVSYSLTQFSQRNGIMLGIWYQNKLAGLIGHQQPIDWTNRLGWLIYWLDSAAQGKGLVTMGAKKVLEYSYNDMGLNKMEIRCTTDNERAIKVAQRLGFQTECKFRSAQWLNGKYHDIQVYGLLASEFGGAS